MCLSGNPFWKTCSEQSGLPTPSSFSSSQTPHSTIPSKHWTEPLRKQHWYMNMLQRCIAGEEQRNRCTMHVLCRRDVIDRTPLIWPLFLTVLMHFLLINDRVIIMYVNHIIIWSQSFLCKASRLCTKRYWGNWFHPQNLTMLPSVSSTFYLRQVMSQRVFALRKIRKRNKWEHMEERFT